MTKVRERKPISYRPDDDIQGYVNRVMTLNPGTSQNVVVDALVRKALEDLGWKPISITFRVPEIKQT
jgi:hypothetical protein